MSSLIFGKEFIVINEELAIYISFIIVLTILVSNFGAVIKKQLEEQADTIAQNYSKGSQAQVQNYLSQITKLYKIGVYVNALANYEKINYYNLLKLKEKGITAIIAAKYKLV